MPAVIPTRPPETTRWTALRGRRVVVLGGSSGIGLAAAAGAARSGAQVTVIARDPDRLAAAARYIRAAGDAESPASIETHAADVRDTAALAAILGRLDAVDHVLLTAGEAGFSDMLGERRTEVLLESHDMRLRAALVVVQCLAPTMRPGGSFVFTGGLLTARPVRGAAVAGLATASLEQLARILAVDLAPLRFNAISPGWTDTPLLDAMLGEAKPAVLEGVIARTPIGRIVHAEEAADAAPFLMANGAMTGEVLHVDGGQRVG